MGYKLKFSSNTVVTKFIPMFRHFDLNFRQLFSDVCGFQKFLNEKFNPVELSKQ